MFILISSLCQFILHNVINDREFQINLFENYKAQINVHKNPEQFLLIREYIISRNCNPASCGRSDAFFFFFKPTKIFTYYFLLKVKIYYSKILLLLSNFQCYLKILVSSSNKEIMAAGSRNLGVCDSQLQGSCNNLIAYI